MYVSIFWDKKWKVNEINKNYCHEENHKSIKHLFESKTFVNK